jgi:hypothetical protein
MCETVKFLLSYSKFIQNKTQYKPMLPINTCILLTSLTIKLRPELFQSYLFNYFLLRQSEKTYFFSLLCYFMQ